MTNRNKTCVECGKEIPTWRVKTCNKECFRAHRYKYQRSRVVLKSPETKRPCIICGVEIVCPKGHPNKKFCPVCKREESRKGAHAFYLKNSERVCEEAKQKRRDTAHLRPKKVRKKMVYRRKHHPMICHTCGIKFSGVSKYCSKECRRVMERAMAKRPEVRERNNRYLRELRAKNPQWAISRNVSCAVAASLAAAGIYSRKESKWKYLGYTRADLVRHCETFFTKENGFTWENRGKTWELDHVIPLSKFTFLSMDDEQFRAAWALTNLRPCPKGKNQEKGNRFAGYYDHRKWVLVPLPTRPLQPA